MLSLISCLIFLPPIQSSSLMPLPTPVQTLPETLPPTPAPIPALAPAPTLAPAPAPSPAPTPTPTLAPVPSTISSSAPFQIPSMAPSLNPSPVLSQTPSTVSTVSLSVASLPTSPASSPSAVRSSAPPHFPTQPHSQPQFHNSSHSQLHPKNNLSPILSCAKANNVRYAGPQNSSHTISHGQISSSQREKTIFSPISRKLSCAEANNIRYIGTHPQPTSSPAHSSTHNSNPQKVYHDSNLAWCSPTHIQRTACSIVNGESQSVQMRKTSRLEDVLHAVQQDDHSGSIVIISVATNNAKAHQSVSHVQFLMEKILCILTRQTSPQNVIFLESPPSLNFDIFPYNQAIFQSCQNFGIFFSFNLLDHSHIKTDGLHILPHYKHLMVKSVSCALQKINPFKYYRVPFLKRHPSCPCFSK